MLPVDPVLVFETDGTFAGLLSAYAVAYKREALPADVRLAGRPAAGALFGEAVHVETDGSLAERVERGLERAKPGLIGRMRRAFLSERPGMDVHLLRLVDAVADRGAGAADDWTFEPAREAARWSSRVGREAHRMEAFVRFERRIDADRPPDGAETWVAIIRPVVHVLPLIGAHFEARYPTLAWRIVDARRGLALVHTPAPHRDAGQPACETVPADAFDLAGEAPDEAAYQRMWQAYFRAVTIPERRNLRLHLRHVPKRYWPYLTEKQG